MSLSFLRSLLFATPLIALSTIVMGTISLIASFFDRSGRIPHQIARMWGRMLLAIGFVRVRGEGLEKIHPGGSYVFVANHTSFMDIPAILALIDVQFRFFAKKGLFQIPFLGTHLKRAGHFPVERDSPRASFKAMTHAADLIRTDGISMLLFPEGGRTAVGEGMREFREGAAFIAIKAGVPVVPVAITGLFAVLPMGSFHLRPGQATIRIGDPIETTGLTVKNRSELTLRLFEELARMTGETRACATLDS